MKIGHLVLGGFLILWGLSMMIPALQGLGIVLGVIALIAGILILIDR